MVHTHTLLPLLSMSLEQISSFLDQCAWLLWFLGLLDFPQPTIKSYHPLLFYQSNRNTSGRKPTVFIFPSPMGWLHPTCLQSSIWHSRPLCLLLSWLLHKYFLGFPSYFINSFSVSYVVSFFSLRPLNIWIPQHSVLGWWFPFKE